MTMPMASPRGLARLDLRAALGGKAGAQASAVFLVFSDNRLDSGPDIGFIQLTPIMWRVLPAIGQRSLATT